MKVRQLLQNNAVTLFVVVVVLFMIIPIPSALLDILLVLNISLSIIILVITMNIQEALEFSIFPSLLLITTLFRLGMNISSTRAILRNGATLGENAAGQVINAFSTLITAGNVVMLPVYLLTGLLTKEVFLRALSLYPAMILGLFLGIRFAGRLKEETVRKCAAVLLIACGLFLTAGNL